MARTKAPNSIQEAVYDELKRGIMTLRLKPGSSMSTQEMADRLNVSRTPVREAFLRLQREGLVESMPQRGTFVSLIDVKRMEQELFLRQSLEYSVLRPFVARATIRDFQRMRELNALQRQHYENGDWSQVITVDHEFHGIMFNVARQQLALEIILSNNGHYDRTRTLSVQVNDFRNDLYAQHDDLVSQLEKGNVEAAQEIIYEHISGKSFDEISVGRVFPNYFAEGREKPAIRVRPL